MCIFFLQLHVSNMLKVCLVNLTWNVSFCKMSFDDFFLLKFTDEDGQKKMPVTASA